MQDSTAAAAAAAAMAPGQLGDFTFRIVNKSHKGSLAVDKEETTAQPHQMPMQLQIADGFPERAPCSCPWAPA